MTAPIQHGGSLAAAIALHGGSPGEWLDLSTGINPCPPPLPGIPADAWHRLPDADRLSAARTAAARFYGLEGALPLAVPGTQSVIQRLPSLAATGRPVAIFSPTYGEYARVFQQAGHRVDLVTDLCEIRPDHAIVVVVNPNNPTGRVLPSGDLVALAGRMAGQGGHLVVDEAFADCTPEISVAATAAHRPGLVVLRSFGKFFGLAGLRLGFVVAEPRILDPFAEALGPWAVSGPALSVATPLLSTDPADLRGQIARRKAALDETLRGAGLRIAGGTALFSLVETDDAAHLHAALGADRILTRIFDYDRRGLRIGLAPDMAGDERLAAALARAAP